MTRKTFKARAAAAWHGRTSTPARSTVRASEVFGLQNLSYPTYHRTTGPLFFSALERPLPEEYQWSVGSVFVESHIYLLFLRVIMSFFPLRFP